MARSMTWRNRRCCTTASTAVKSCALSRSVRLHKYTVESVNSTTKWRTLTSCGNSRGHIHGSTGKCTHKQLCYSNRFNYRRYSHCLPMSYLLFLLPQMATAISVHLPLGEISKRSKHGRRQMRDAALTRFEGTLIRPANLFCELLAGRFERDRWVCIAAFISTRPLKLRFEA